MDEILGYIRTCTKYTCVYIYMFAVVIRPWTKLVKFVPFIKKDSFQNRNAKDVKVIKTEKSNLSSIKFVWAYGPSSIKGTKKLLKVINSIIIIGYYISHPPPDQISSRFWYAFSLFQRKFHSVRLFDDYFCEPAEPGFLRKRWTFYLRMSAKHIVFYLQPNSNRFQAPSRAVHGEREEWTSSRHGLCSKMWNPTNRGGNFVSFNMEKGYQFLEKKWSGWRKQRLASVLLEFKAFPLHDFPHVELCNYF